MSTYEDQTRALQTAVLRVIPKGAPLNVVLDALVTCYLNIARDNDELRLVGRLMTRCGPLLAQGKGLQEAWEAANAPIIPLPDMGDAVQVATIARALDSALPEGTSDAAAVCGLLTLLVSVACTHPEVRRVASALMRSAADELLTFDGAAFQGAFANVRPGRPAATTH